MRGGTGRGDDTIFEGSDYLFEQEVNIFASNLLDEAAPNDLHGVGDRHDPSECTHSCHFCPSERGILVTSISFAVLYPHLRANRALDTTNRSPSVTT